LWSYFSDPGASGGRDSAARNATNCCPGGTSWGGKKNGLAVPAVAKSAVNGPVDLRGFHLARAKVARAMPTGGNRMPTIKSGSVRFQFPLWLISLPSIKIKGIVNATDPDSIKAIMLFSDEHLAKRFLEADSKLARHVLRPIVEQWHFFGVLALLEKAGFRNVVIDPPPAPATVSAFASRTVRIADLRAHVEQLVLL
jgi:hypothetical protein